MTRKVLTHSEFVDSVRGVILDALDAHVEALTGGALRQGWTDADLPDLFRGLDPHVAQLVARINAAEGSAAGIEQEL